MSFMQFEFDLAPALIGVSIYVVCQLLLRALAPTKKAKEDSPKADFLTKDIDITEEVAGEAWQECDEPEPVPELAAEPEGEQSPSEVPPSAKTSSTRWLAFSWRALALVLVASRVAMPLLSYFSGDLSDVLLATQGFLPIMSYFSRELSEDWLSEISPESLAVEKPPSNSANYSAKLEQPLPDLADYAAKLDMLEQVDRVQAQDEQKMKEQEEVTDDDGHEAFSVKLVRQVMNDDDYVRSAYYGTLMVGTPALEMTVVFDTGSGHLVLPSAYCKSETCKAHTRYRRSASKSARDIDTKGNTWLSGPRDSVTVSFGTGEVTGVFVEDLVCMSDLSNVSAMAQASEGRPECTLLHFLAATELSEDPFKKFHFDGILGLGLSGLSQTSKFNFMEVMAQSIRGLGGRNPSTFGVYLGNHNFEDSEIALGGWARKHLKEDLTWGPLHDPDLGHWIVPIRGVRVDGTVLDFCNDGTCRAAVDTGTSLLAVPTAVFREMYEYLRHPAPLSGHCRGFGPLLHIELNDFTVSLGPKDYGQVKKTHKSLYPKPRLFEGKNAGGRPDLRCLPMLMTLDLEEPIGPKIFVLGEPVLRKYYTVYDAQRLRVGVGRARHTKVPSREELLEMATDVDPVARRRLPTMFDVFRWRKALQ